MIQEDLSQQLLDTLKKQFRLTDFREGQLRAITTLMAQGRLLCIQPTGYGKSLLYQLPAVLLEGITLVISPLLALMRDQLTQLQQRFGIEATSFNTDQTLSENKEAKRAVLAGKVRILFIAPEQLGTIDCFNFILGLPIKLLVVDEAHCISTWGHDFRPSYRQITSLVQALVKKIPDIKLLALTATANKKIEEDIKQQLTVDDQTIVVHRESMDRPNIRLSVLPVDGISEKLATLVESLQSVHGSGLVYCATRENTELVAEFLTGQNIPAAAYHAGLATEQKRRIQHDFFKDQYTVIAATNALGMGIDKSNLRFIIHFDFPGSMTAYYQEIGRAGRDGLPADGLLLYDPADRRIHQYFIDSAQPNEEEVTRLLNHITHSNEASSITTLKHRLGIHPTKLSVILAELIEQGYIQKNSQYGHQTYHAIHRVGKPNLQRYQTQRQVKQVELSAMQRYAEYPQNCLMAVLRNTLGDIEAPLCGKCSRCNRTPFTRTHDSSFLAAISSWLSNRTIPIRLSPHIQHTTTGIAVLDGKHHPDVFMQFMRQRTDRSITAFGISDTLLQLIKTSLLELGIHHSFSCIIPIPSNTWAAQPTLTNYLAKYLHIPAIQDILHWSILKKIRQGELLDNEQRHHNVAERMHATLRKKIPAGTILLFDDYIGSGATLNEAARALREHAKLSNPILPFAITAVKWRLGKNGLINPNQSKS